MSIENKNNLTTEELTRCISYILWNVGIFPQSIQGSEDPSINYGKRDDYRNGWNDGVMSVTKQFDKLLETKNQLEVFKEATEWEKRQEENEY